MRLYATKRHKDGRPYLEVWDDGGVAVVVRVQPHPLTWWAKTTPAEFVANNGPRSQDRWTFYPGAA